MLKGGPDVSGRSFFAISRPCEARDESVRLDERRAKGTYTLPSSPLEYLREGKRLDARLLPDPGGESVEHDDCNGAELDDGGVGGVDRGEGEQVGEGRGDW